MTEPSKESLEKARSIMGCVRGIHGGCSLTDKDGGNLYACVEHKAIALALDLARQSGRIEGARRMQEAALDAFLPNGLLYKSRIRALKPEEVVRDG